MTAEETRIVMEFEDGLTVGQPVKARWTNSGRYFVGRGTISKVNGLSVRVKLTEHVATEFYGGYPVGHELVIPKLGLDTRWSSNNRVEQEG
jgi:hypothetical protein